MMPGSTSKLLALLVIALMLVADAATAADPVTQHARKLVVLRTRVLDRLNFRASRLQLALAGKNEKIVVEDQLGERWLFKFADPVHPISVLGEVAAASVSTLADGRVPEAHVVTLRVNGEPVYGSIQRMVPVTSTLDGVDPRRLSRRQLAQLLALQVFDWMIGDFDTKGQNKGVLPDGSLVNLDKTQFHRFFGGDRLDWNYHPNARPGNVREFNASIEPYASKVWKSWIAREIELDPAPLGSAIDLWEAMEEDAFSEALRGFAWTRFVLLPKEKTVRPAKFLAALVVRKQALRRDFAHFVERAAEARGDGAKLELPRPRRRVAVQQAQAWRLQGEIEECENRLARLPPGPAGASSDIQLPLDQAARLRLLAFKASSESIASVRTVLQQMQRARTHPMARRGVGEYLERLRRHEAGEIPREKVECVLHGRGF